MNSNQALVWCEMTEPSPATAKSTVMRTTARKKVIVHAVLALAALAGGAPAAHATVFFAAAPVNPGLDADALATGVGSIAEGIAAKAAGPYSIALGMETNAVGMYSMALGKQASALNDEAIATGFQATASGTFSIATGVQSVAQNYGSVATGVQARALGDSSTAIGAGSYAKGDDTVALGAQAKAFATNAAAVGHQAAASGMNSFAGGNAALAGADNTVALGGEAQATGLNSVALGSNAAATTENSVALGANSTATASLTAQGYSPTGSGATSIAAPVAKGEVSLGSAGNERRLTNVAAGAAATDAVNVSQLSAVDGKIDAIAQSGTQHYFNADGIADGSDDAVASGTHALAAGASASATGADALALGSHATASDAGSVALGARAAAGAAASTSIGESSAASAAGATAIGAYSSVTGAGGAALGYMATASADNSVALGQGSVARRANTVSVGSAGRERQITNVAAGTADTDAVNVGQLKVAITASAVTYDRNEDGSVNTGSATLAGPTSSDGGVTGGTTITNVHQGAVSASSTDAMNGAQLYAVTGDISDTYVQQNGHGIKYVRTDDDSLTPDDAHAAATGASAIGYSAQADGENSVALGRGAHSGTAGAIAIGYDADASAANSVALGQGSIANRAGTVSVGSAGNERQLTNVAAGTADTDAVNVAQLKAMSDQGVANAAKLDGAVMYDQNADGSVNRNSVTLGGDAANGGTLIHNVAAGVDASDAVNVAQLNAAIGGMVNNAVVNTANPFFSAEGDHGTGGAVSSGTHSVAAGANAQATGGNAVAIGANSLANAANATSLGANSVASGVNATALGAAANASADNSVALGQSSVADRANTVPVGAVGQERQITNVAAGVQGTDAVNVKQLQQSFSGAVSQANSYTDDQIRSARRDSYGGTASAMAMAGLPQAILPGHGMVAMAGGTYAGQSALAVGVSQISETGKWVYKVQGTTDSRGQFGASIGAGMHW
jgi:autotransporter adhesin